MSRKARYQFRVTGFGERLYVTASTRGAAVHQFRRLTGRKIATDKETGGWIGVQVENSHGDPAPKRLPPAVLEHDTPPQDHSGDIWIPPQSYFEGLHPGTWEPTPAWEWQFHSAGPKGGTKPIVSWGEPKGGKKAKKSTGKELPCAK